MKGLNLVKVKALSAFTKTTKHGQFHGDPDSKRNAYPRIPDYVVEELTRLKLVEEAEQDPLDHDGNGRKGGSRKGRRASAKAKGGQALPPVETGPYAAKHVRFGNYEITGPDGFSETVKGKEAAEQKAAELNASAVKTAPAGAGDAPVD